MKKYIIKLSNNERAQLQVITRKGTHNARVIKRARILMESDAGARDATVAAKVEVSISTVHLTRKRYAEGGIDRALYDAPRSGTPRALNDKQEAYLVAIACSDPPEGHIHWTVELLRERLLTDGIVDSVSVGTIHARLTERGVKPWRKKNVVHSTG